MSQYSEVCEAVEAGELKHGSNCSVEQPFMASYPDINVAMARMCTIERVHQANVKGDGLGINEDYANGWELGFASGVAAAREILRRTNLKGG